MSTLTVNTINETTAANGVVIDGLKVKDYSLMYGSNIGLTIDSSGRTTQPNQPSFQFRASTGQTNKSANVTHTVLFGTEVFDIGNNFASNTFTAPVTGKYQFNVSLRLDGVPYNSTYFFVGLVTSNRTIHVEIVGTDQWDANANYFTAANSIVTDMDASDTAYVTYYQSGGSAATDIIDDSRFSGFLVG